ncbi:hypothetical protein ACHAXS_006484 [Conticribra weissflogii]
MASMFVPGSVLYLDQSMSSWDSMLTCSGWVFCPWKPQLIYNDCYTFRYAQSWVFMQIDLEDGKDHPKELTNPLFHKKNKSYNATIFNFKDIFVGILIKKHGYWSAIVPGKVIESNFEGKAVGKHDEVGKMFHLGNVGIHTIFEERD